MLRKLMVVLAAAALQLGTAPARAQDADTYTDTDPSALDDFHEDLDRYGQWVETLDSGTVWVPSPSSAGFDFRPYVSNGHWAWNNEWVWVSDYPWAVTFHYGRWVR